MVEQRSRDDRHSRIAAIIAAGGADADRLIGSARQVCATWRAERLVSDDYLEAWEGLLQAPYASIAATLADQSPAAYAYRQCSAFIRSPEWYAVAPPLVQSVVDLARARIQPGYLNSL
ncbi:hypothetical protein CLD22_08095 [Rubrivivax gelatinosus]|nr:hypothetical protein [Rubrivivax gelatinosus]